MSIPVLETWGVHYSLTYARNPNRRFDSCRVYFPCFNPYSFNEKGFYFSPTDARNLSRRFDSCRVYFSCFNPRLLNEWGFTFSHRWKKSGSQVRFLAGGFFNYAKSSTATGGRGMPSHCEDFVRCNRIPSLVRPTSETIYMFAGRHTGLPLRNQ
ncbi:MAG: hypothetical protein RL169_1533 [Armatimonadota bacterium]